MTEPDTRPFAWDTPGLPPRARGERCARHSHCQFRDDDPAYCPYCHVTWTKVDGSELNRSEHVWAHRNSDTKRTASAVRLAEYRR